jgi:hypothetical protein
VRCGAGGEIQLIKASALQRDLSASSAAWRRVRPETPLPCPETLSSYGAEYCARPRLTWEELKR